MADSDTAWVSHEPRLAPADTAWIRNAGANPSHIDAWANSQCHRYGTVQEVCNLSQNISQSVQETNVKVNIERHNARDEIDQYLELADQVVEQSLDEVQFDNNGAQ